MVGPEWDDSLFAIVNTGEQDAHSTEDCVEWSDIVRTSAMVLTIPWKTFCNAGSGLPSQLVLPAHWPA